MASNKKRREELERIFGEGSMFQKAKTEEYISTLPKIKGYRRFLKERHFTTKELRKLTKRMNYHHLEHRADGGTTTIENGAVVNEAEHRYIHSLPRNQEEIINNHIRKWKADFISMTTDGIIDHKEVDIDLNQDFIEIPTHDYKPKKVNKKHYEEKQRKREDKEFLKLKKELESRW